MISCECGHEIRFVPGIGDYCSNKRCPIAEKRWEQWQKRKSKKLGDFVAKLQAKMHYNQYSYTSDGMQKLLESEIENYIKETNLS